MANNSLIKTLYYIAVLEEASDKTDPNSPDYVIELDPQYNVSTDGTWDMMTGSIGVRYFTMIILNALFGFSGLIYCFAVVDVVAATLGVIVLTRHLKILSADPVLA